MPIFDRNQQGIQAAEKERAKVRSDYEAVLNESLATLESLYQQYRLARERRRLLQDEALPQAEANLDLALQSIRAGTIDSLKYLEVERTLRTLLIESIDAERGVRHTLSELEQVIGVPLVLFPTESMDDYPFLPERADKSAGQETVKHSEE